MPNLISGFLFLMVSILEVAIEYCKENNLPPPSQKDLRNAGQFVGTHFRRFWGPKQPASIISKAGFMYTKEDGKEMLILGYPIEFKEEMLNRIAIFYQEKAARIAKNINEKPATSDHKKPPPTQRKRTPLNQKPAFSGNKFK